ncbi:MAG: DUF4058 family protein [Gemmataceae bacterium]
MPSPFPGMNPYLERAEVWHDFHTRFIPAAASAIGKLVAPKYFTKIEEHLYVHEPSAEHRFSLGRPEISVHPSAEARQQSSGETAVIDAPASVGMLMDVDFERVRYLEIRDRFNREVVTVFELLSPSNKYAGADRSQYVSKVKRVLESQTNFVELDLLRGGPRMSWAGLPKCDYYALVSRAGTRFRDPPEAQVWPIGLRDRLPKIPIPLRAGEPEPLLDLQAIVDEVYDAAGYSLYIYDGSPEPQLSPTDAEWAERLLR